jgi:phage terminase large subunit-like protein
MIDTATEEWTLNESDRLAVAAGCRFSVGHGEDVCTFIERFAHLSQGRWAGQKLKLIKWQRDFLMRLYGWRQENGKRRFRRAFLMAAKKSGKSPLMSAIALYMLLADGENAPEIYICACDRDQAGIIFQEAQRMCQFSPALGKRVEVIPSRKIIVAGHGRIVANSADAPKLDGLNASCVLYDELHRQPNRLLYDVMEHSVAAREQPLTIMITTAGESESDEEIWYEVKRYSEQVTAGIIPDHSFLGVVYAADESDDIDDPGTWRKANPSLGVTFTEDDFRRDLEEAKTSPAKLQNFKRLRLNIVCQTDSAFVPLEDWDACRGRHEVTADTPLYLGLDLSSRDDLTALVGIFGDFDSGVDVSASFWLPKDDIAELERRHNVPYRQWTDEGWITLTEGSTVDYQFVEKNIVNASEKYRLIKLFCDPWNGKQLCERILNEHRLPLEFLRQGFASLSDPTKRLWELIRSRKIRHDGNPVLRWMISNSVVLTDPAGNWKISKGKRAKKVDGVAALINAVAAAIASGGDIEPSVYETRGPIFLDAGGNVTSPGPWYLPRRPLY